MRVATISEAPVAGLVLEERLTGLYRRKQVVENLIRSLEQYENFQPFGGFHAPKGRAPLGAQGVVYGLLR